MDSEGRIQQASVAVDNHEDPPCRQPHTSITLQDQVRGHPGDGDDLAGISISGVGLGVGLGEAVGLRLVVGEAVGGWPGRL